MDWQNAAEELNAGGGGGGGIFMKVMTDEQMEVLRKQIAVYAVICQQLVDLHKSFTAQNDLAVSASGVRMGNMHCDPLITSGMHKMTSRQRWTPTSMQLQILERIFEQGTGNPSRARIQEITRELSQHGQISQTNVSNWFQNRRARSKRKQQTLPVNGSESEVEKEIEIKTTAEEDLQVQPKLNSNNVCFENSQDDDSDIHSVVRKSQPIFHQESSSKFDQSFEQISFYGSVLPNERKKQSVEEMEVPVGNYNPYLQQHDCHMAGL